VFNLLGLFVCSIIHSKPMLQGWARRELSRGQKLFCSSRLRRFSIVGGRYRRLAPFACNSGKLVKMLLGRGRNCGEGRDQGRDDLRRRRLRIDTSRGRRGLGGRSGSRRPSCAGRFRSLMCSRRNRRRREAPRFHSVHWSGSFGDRFTGTTHR
jgi:hypothetical protein